MSLGRAFGGLEPEAEFQRAAPGGIVAAADAVVEHAAADLDAAGVDEGEAGGSGSGALPSGPGRGGGWGIGGAGTSTSSTDSVS